ncbi:MAG: type II toxin-antitoxin system RelE/ParE family toxin [Deltaproteobacteria bacterium]|nr:type II toxin-antitoxin system RelE/ParE family toxin [Deltaproteobacteria bacterium]NNE17058.1 type II toxin-antitoxin system RelE/ParE family toxin [Myxococcales bacterium]NNK08660.1 type II toxin-antitoxin system RelE/ParE family toxin [Myxococcales bacterium]NNK43105.1 type II toxin-antitoxin system RelE/ParE family toxin [Myxococcales bacterium]
MKRTLRVLPDAEAELQSAAMWYEKKRRGLGIEFVAVVDRAFQSVLENPEACPVWRPDRPYRQRLLKRFPYVVFSKLTRQPSKSLQWRTRSDALVIG